MRVRFSHLSGSLPAHLVLAAYSLGILVPLGWMLASSVKSRREIMTSASLLPSSVDFSGYERALAGGLPRYMFNSLVVTSVSTVLIVVLGSLAAYALARLRLRLAPALYLIVIGCYAVPLHGILVPLYDLLVALGLTNSLAGLVLPYVAFGLPFSIMILYAFFAEFPEELIEAARLDGYGELSILFRVVLPLSLPALTSVAIFQVISIWNEFLLALLVVSDKAVKTVPLGLLGFRGDYSNDWTAILASLVISSLPIVVLYVIFQKSFVKSLAGIGK